MELKPTNLTFEEAAAVPQAGVLALQGVHKAGQIQPGQKVLINGAGGGVGTFAIQLAKLSGAEVTGVDASHKLKIIRSAGADHAIDYTQVDFTKTGEHYDLIIDCQNFRSMFDIMRALEPEGIYAMIGGSMLRVYQLWLLSLCAPLTRESRKLRLVAEGPNKGLADLKALIEAGKLIPVIDRVYKLSEVPEAIRYFNRRSSQRQGCNHYGKLDGQSWPIAAHSMPEDKCLLHTQQSLRNGQELAGVDTKQKLISRR